MDVKNLSEKDGCSHLAGGDVEVAGNLVEGERPVHPASILLYLYLRLSKIVKCVSKCHISINAWSCVPSNDLSYLPKSKVTFSPSLLSADSVWTLAVKNRIIIYLQASLCSFDCNFLDGISE